MPQHVLAPVEPTPAMIAAAGHPDAAPVWRAMMAARPAIQAGMVAVLPALGVNRRNPDFWGDHDVRNLVIDNHRQITIEQLRSLIESRVGPERVPSKSAIARTWQRLDKATARPGRVRKGR